MPYFSFTKIKHHRELQQIMESLNSQTTASKKEVPSTPVILSGDQNLWENGMIECYRRSRNEDVHISVTLDQFYYHSLKDTESRNIDQVLMRHQQQMACNVRDSSEYLLCMVDQLWVYVIDDGRPVIPINPGRKVISDHIINDKDQRPHIASAHEMIALVTALCARRTIDRELGKDKKQLLQIFASAIAKAADTEVRLFEEFMKTLDGNGHADRNSKYNISSEITLLKEVKDIQDELNIINNVLTMQNMVLEDTFGFLGDHDIVEYYRNLGRIDQVLEEMKKLIYDADRVHRNVMGITFAVSVPLVALAFFVNEAADFFSDSWRIIQGQKSVTGETDAFDKLENKETAPRIRVTKDGQRTANSDSKKWLQRRLRANRGIFMRRHGNEETLNSESQVLGV
ncbi:hypothetical protein NHQ30_003901 [Ciborinia camelliae]|nr:hypothetical protein NHQ30_003901 [Ciborinia camelliae]